jgi:hypothetical protein
LKEAMMAKEVDMVTASVDPHGPAGGSYMIWQWRLEDGGKRVARGFITGSQEHVVHEAEAVAQKYRAKKRARPTPA